jgi:hypothetical protein
VRRTVARGCVCARYSRMFPHSSCRNCSAQRSLARRSEGDGPLRPPAQQRRRQLPKSRKAGPVAGNRLSSVHQLTPTRGAQKSPPPMPPCEFLMPPPVAVLGPSGLRVRPPPPNLLLGPCSHVLASLRASLRAAACAARWGWSSIGCSHPRGFKQSVHGRALSVARRCCSCAILQRAACGRARERAHAPRQRG